jgi:serine/threonine-protein kinase
MVEPDTIVDGRYRVVSRVGSGGMADVYLAEDELLGRHVALKLLHHHFAEDQEFVERFRREASSAAALSHQNIVGIFDRGEWQGTYYIAMEYVPGRSLKSIVREQGALDPAAAIGLVVQILRAARFAHRRGVIHRDFKPHNVIVDDEGRARVTDFGIARAGASDMTLTGSIMGTAQYLSPEQAQGQPVSEPSDLYSVGVILYELLTGVVPFEGDSAVAIAFKQVAAEPLAPSALNPAVPPGLDAIVLRALAKDPAARFADADEFISALQHEREALPTSTGAPVLVGAHSALPTHHPGASGGGALLLPAEGPAYEEPPRSERDGQRRRRLLLAGLAALLLAGGVALALVLTGGPAKVTVPSVAGLSESAASTKLRRAGLRPLSTSASSANVPSGQVISQTPAGGRKVAKGTRVSFSVSSGPGSAALPKVEGLSGAHAVARLRAAGFKPTTKTQPSATASQGIVIGTEPPAGTELQLGSAVSVLVSSGPLQVRVPNVVGQSRTAAEAALTNAGLEVGTVSTQASSAQPAGNVLSQSPRGGLSVRAGSKVNLSVAQVSNEVSVPGVVGQEEARAAAALGGAGLVPKIVSVPTSDVEKVGVVLKQSPPAGRKARKGATVTLSVGEQATTPTTPTTPTTTTPTTPTTTSPPAAGAAPPLK